MIPILYMLQIHCFKLSIFNYQGKQVESQKYIQELDKAKEELTRIKHERDQVNNIYSTIRGA